MLLKSVFVVSAAVIVMTQHKQAAADTELHNTNSCLYHWLHRAGIPHANASRYSKALEAAGVAEKMIMSTLPAITMRAIMRSDPEDAIALKNCIAGRSIKCRGYHPCRRGGECVLDFERPTSLCKCRPGLYGHLCKKDNLCYRSPCQNGGKCIDQGNRYSCRCHVGYEGDRCETRWLRTDTHKLLPEELRNVSKAMQELTDEVKGMGKLLAKLGKDNCGPVVCEHGGQCVDQDNGYLCVCKLGFAGQHCERIVLGTSWLNPASSCEQIYTNGQQTSGIYWIKGFGKQQVPVYCSMTAGGGWMRVVYIDVTRIGCPPLFDTISSPVHVCALKSGPGCTSVKFSSHGIKYSEVRGYAYGHQFHATDGFYSISEGIDSYYVDGVSVTHGDPREHIWTFAAGRSQNYNYPSFNCPCSEHRGPSPAFFVGEDYYCESGMKGEVQNDDRNGSWSTERLWDGQCYSKSECCARTDMPFFTKSLARVTKDALEVRICITHSLQNENVGLAKMELFVR